ncbi:MaoC family dehydratase N-terminal domain-containing protein [Saccharopolyspora sp. HNM0983]|uniref:MaoC family dehydratase N-terminal domain-containing protein n=1 Tax=Saccharopolyspora montiporae TaxID=2781240 RepID=A0A929G0R8_9PSEU|nr:MaoC/PaaZ C-terminal domain-containing protein [Saccharopolyspora sp. HNM0983]MBE9375905.1 MaoC family dehydratase N-terminal domain-containing protein [Saccharopolyspora sp. HNM0983]
MTGLASDTDGPAFDTDGLGRWTEEDAFDVTRERIAQYAAATNDPIPAHRAGEIAPPVFGIVPVFPSLIPAALSVAPPELLGKLVHGEQDFVFHRPIRPGERLVSRARPVGVDGKPAGTAVLVRTETRDVAGELVNEQWMTAFFRKVDAGSRTGESAPAHGFDEALRDVAPAAEVTGHVDDDQTFRYAEAAGDPMPIHLDEEMARASGLPGIIAHGLCTMAFTSWAVLTELARSDTARLRRLAVRFAKPVLPGQDLNTRIWRSGTEPGATTYAYETGAAGRTVIADGLAVLADRTE